MDCRPAWQVAARIGKNGRCKPEPGPINELNALPVVGVDGVSIALCIGNAGESRRGPLTAALMGPARLTGCGGKDGPPRIGLCEALITSSNIYFAGLALFTDRDKVPPRGSPETHHGVIPDFRIARMARRLFPDGYEVEERRKADHKVPRGIHVLHSTVPGVSPKLVASPIVIGAEMKRERPPVGAGPAQAATHPGRFRAIGVGDRSVDDNSLCLGCGWQNCQAAPCWRWRAAR